MLFKNTVKRIAQFVNSGEYWKLASENKKGFSSPPGNDIISAVISRKGERLGMKQYVVDAFTDSVFHGNQAALYSIDELFIG